MSVLSKGLKLLKILVDPFFEENMIKDVIGVFSEDAGKTSHRKYARACKNTGHPLWCSG